MADKNEWGSNLSFIMAMTGYAVGLENIRRYPHVFYIHYILIILLKGIPFNPGIWCVI